MSGHIHPSAVVRTDRSHGFVWSISVRVYPRPYHPGEAQASHVEIKRSTQAKYASVVSLCRKTVTLSLPCIPWVRPGTSHAHALSCGPYARNCSAAAESECVVTMRANPTPGERSGAHGLEPGVRVT